MMEGRGTTVSIFFGGSEEDATIEFTRLKKIAEETEVTTDDEYALEHCTFSTNDRIEYNWEFTGPLKSIADFLKLIIESESLRQA